MTDAIDLFLAQAMENPNAPAVVLEDDVLSYGTVARKVRLLAGMIAAHRSFAKVLIALPPGADAYAAMLASGMAGAVYAPVNLRAPVSKQRAITDHFQPDIVLASQDDWENFAMADDHTLFIDPEDYDDDTCLPESGMLAATVPKMERHVLSYIIFTSGSTGKPKGVEIPRTALNHYVAWLKDGLDIKPGDRLSQYANIAFDLSVMEIYGGLCHGASLHPPAGLGDRLLPARMINREKLTHWISVPSVVTLMRESGELTGENTASVRRFVFCGEPLTLTHVTDLFRASPGAIVQNTYGPTEATVSMTSVLLTSADLPRLTEPTVMLGAPIPGMEVHLVGGPDENEGEMVLVGPQLACGYLDDSETTNRAFKKIKIGEETCTGYFTGDWARRINQELFFRNRIDFQIKHKGYRIELGEIISALNSCEVIESCVFSAGNRLVAVVEMAPGIVSSAAGLRSALARRLDSYAVPDEVVILEHLPRNDNDKVDRNAARSLYESGAYHSVNQGSKITNVPNIVNVPITKFDPKSLLNR